MPAAGAAGPLLALVLLAPSHAPTRGPESPLVQAMREEMARAMTGLRMPDQPAPYFIACTVDDIAGRHAQATSAPTSADNRQRIRMVRVDVRVGDYARDNSRFISFDLDPGVTSMFASGVVQARSTTTSTCCGGSCGWRSTRPTAGRSARSPRSRQRCRTRPPRTGARLVEGDAADDAAAGHRAGRAADAWVAHARAVSAALARPELTRNEATSRDAGRALRVNSEGFTTVAPLQQRGCGCPPRHRPPTACRCATCPRTRDDRRPAAPAELVARARELAAGLAALRAAPVGDDYTGPVLVEGQAAAELLAQTLVPLFLRLRPPEPENPQMAAHRADTRVRI